MFYRLKFDNAVAQMLDTCGFHDTNAKFAFWPAGYTPQGVKTGKSRGLNATEAAALAICDLLFLKVRQRQLTPSMGEAMCRVCQRHLQSRAETSQAFLDELQECAEAVAGMDGGN